jgi:hypothetical protein
MPNPWDCPPWPERGDDNINIIFAAVGRALTYWETVEEELANIFSILVGNRATYPATEPAIRAYGTVISSISRTKMLSAAATSYFAGDLKGTLAQEIKDIIDHANGWAARRNDIAHGRVGKIKSRPGYLLFPSLYNTKKHPVGARPTYLFSSTEINDIHGNFRQLQTRIYAFRLALAHVPKPSADKRQQQ